MAINYVTQFQTQLDQKYAQDLVTSDLGLNGAKFINAQTIQIPTITVSGYKEHSRAGGFKSGTIGNTFQAKTLAHGVVRLGRELHWRNDTDKLSSYVYCRHAFKWRRCGFLYKNGRRGNRRQHIHGDSWLSKKLFRNNSYFFFDHTIRYRERIEVHDLRVYGRSNLVDELWNYE